MTSLNLKRIKRKIQKVIRAYYLSVPQLVECNICGYKGRHFLNNKWQRYVICPSCESDIRHRLLLAAISHNEWAKNIIHGKHVLHFAAEPMLEKRFRNYAASYLTADLFRKGFDLKLDISDMSSVENGKFDLLIACDVLEHVKDHIKAMHEIYRVLSNRGYAILTVPQKDNLKTTFEDPTIIDSDERERIFGQSDHWRIYGDDFSSMLEEVGFKVTIVSQLNFTKRLVEKHVLSPSIQSKHPLATNYRKVFFAYKN
jgi:SAM-dependent methyltransferase